MIDFNSLLPFFEDKDDFIHFLKECPLLKNISNNDLNFLIKESSIKKIKSGNFFCDYKDKLDNVSILLHGRLKLSYKAEDDKTISNDIIPSQSIGEIDILSHAAKPVQIIAIRDSILLQISNANFLKLLQKSFKTIENTCNTIAYKLHSHFSIDEKKNSISTIALIPTNEACLIYNIGKKLKDALKPFGKTLLINSKMIKELKSDKEDSFFVKYLANAENNYRWVILEADIKLTQWTKFILRSCDRIALLLTEDSTELSEIENHILKDKNIFAQKDFIIIHDTSVEITDTKKLLKKRNNIPHYHLNIYNKEDINRISRVLTKRAIGLVLSGGGAKGISQIGILRTLLKENIPIDFIGGTSIGSAVSGLYALGYKKEDLKKIGYDIFIGSKGLIDITIPIYSFIKGKKLHKKLLYYANKDIEDLSIPYFAISTNLTQKKQKIHTSGPLYQAIRASISIPGIFPVCWEDNNILVDGGLFNLFPIDIMANFSDVNQIIAVDSSSILEPFFLFPCAKHVSGLSLLKEKFLHKKNIFPTICPLLSRMADLGGQMKKNQLIESNIATLYIRPPIDDYGTLDFYRYDAIEEIGYRYSQENINKWKQKIKYE